VISATLPSILNNSSIKCVTSVVQVAFPSAVH
jgi:hypothetical protein